MGTLATPAGQAEEGQHGPNTCQVVTWHILVHAIYSSNPDPQHHARVWTRFQQISNLNFCYAPCVTWMPFSHVS